MNRQDGPLLVGAEDQDTPGKIVPLLRNSSGELIVTSGGAAGADTNLISVGGEAIELGQATMADSLPVVIASDQSPIPITGSISATNPSVDATGGAVPSDATYIGINLGGNLSGAVAGHGTAAAALRVELPTDGTGVIATVSAVTAITNALPAGNNNIGDVDVASLPALPAGTNVIGHVITDTGSTTAVTGNVTVVQPTGTNLHTVIDSGTLTTVSTVTAVTAITNALPAGNNNIGDVDVASGTLTAVTSITNPVTVAQATAANLNATVVQATGSNLHTVVDSGTITTITNAVTVSQATASSLNAQVVGNIAHDSADSGNPVKVGYIAYSPDGTTPGTAVAELDRSNAKSDLDGRLYVNPVSPQRWTFHSDGSSALTDTTVKASPGAGFQTVITSIIFSTGAATACNIFFEEGASKILGPWYLEAVNGRGVVWIGEKPITAATAVTVTTSAAIAQCIDVCGYVQAV